MFEKEEDYRKAREESKDRITKVIKVWSGREEAIHDGGFEQGAEFGYNKAKLKLRNCMNCKHRDTKGHSSCKDKGIVLCSHWEVKE